MAIARTDVVQDGNLDNLHSSETTHIFDVNFSVISKTKNFLDALESINSEELGNQIKQIIKEENRQFNVE
tara:strand:+ start:1174 stop:1383 length:210 start_codon:yes stop_codon:yes gene_type:complete